MQFESAGDSIRGRNQITLVEEPSRRQGKFSMKISLWVSNFDDIAVSMKTLAVAKMLPQTMRIGKKSGIVREAHAMQSNVDTGDPVGTPASHDLGKCRAELRGCFHMPLFLDTLENDESGIVSVDGKKSFVTSDDPGRSDLGASISSSADRSFGDDESMVEGIIDGTLRSFFRQRKVEKHAFGVRFSPPVDIDLPRPTSRACPGKKHGTIEDRRIANEDVGRF